MKPLAALAFLVAAQVALAVLPQASDRSKPGDADPLSGSGVRADTRADLVIQAIDRYDDNHVRVVVRNLSSAGAVASWARVKFSSAELGVRFVFQPVPAMQPGDSFEFALPVEGAVADGEVEQMIEGSADYFRQVNESNETNNARGVSSLRLF